MGVTELISKFIFITLNSWKDNSNVYKFSSRRKHSNVFRNCKLFLFDASNIQALFCKVKMAMSKYQLAGSFEKKILTLQEKIKFLDYAEANEKLGYRKLADVFKIGKTAANNILKNKQMLREQYEHFHDKNKKRSHPGKYKVINDIFYEWYQKCCTSNFYPNGPLMKEEAMEIKNQLQNSDLDGFVASDGWLEKWKATYAIKEKRIVGAGGDVPEETVSSWIERLQELREGYSLENIWNTNESGCFFKALPDAGLVQKRKQAKGGKKSKQRFPIAFFISGAGQKIDEPIFIWKSKFPRCFNGLRDPSRPGNVHYFSNSKSWMTSEIFETVLSKLNRKLVFENRKVILFLDNATCRRESMDDKFSNIKIVFLPKNTTSRLQPLDAGIIRNFKVKYRKSLVKYVLSRINDNASAVEVVQDGNILMAIRWVQRAWKDVTSSTVKRCFEKCGFREGDDKLMEDVDFDAELATAEPGIKIDTLGWRQKGHAECIDSVINSAFHLVVISDESEDEVEVYKNERGPNLKETLEMLDKIYQCPALDEKQVAMLGDIT